jgi:hypothetical protein
MFFVAGMSFVMNVPWISDTFKLNAAWLWNIARFMPWPRMIPRVNLLLSFRSSPIFRDYVF